MYETPEMEEIKMNMQNALLNLSGDGCNPVCSPVTCEEEM